MEDLRIFSKIFMKNIILKSTKRRDYGMNIDLLTIWLLTLLSPMEDSCGPARTMMEMSNLMLWHKVMDH